MGGIDDPVTDCGGCGEDVGAENLDPWAMCKKCCKDPSLIGKR